MGAIPPPIVMGPPRRSPLNPNQQALNNLNRSIRMLNSTIVNANQRSLREIGRNLRDYADAIGNLNKAFIKADDVQIKALSINSSLRKVIEVNSNALGKMQGSFLDNAEELLLNFTEGIRENSDDLNTLNNRMRLTGQSTDLLRAVMGQMSVLTGGTLDAVSDLTRSNIELSKTYGVTSESLLQAIASVSNLVDKASFVDSSKQVADLAQSVRALAGDKASAQVTRALNFFLDPKFLATRFALGIGQAEDILTSPAKTTNERLESFIDLTRLSANRLKDLNNVQGLSNKIYRSEMSLSRFGDTESLRAIVNLQSTLDRQLQLGNALKDDQSNILNSAKATDELARSFYEESLANFYPEILQGMKLLVPAALAAGGLGVAGLGKGLSKFGAIAGLAGTALKFLGPVGFAAGTVLTFLPELNSLFKSIFGENKEQTDIQKELLNRTPKLEKEKVRSGTVSDFILKNVSDIISRSGMQSRNNPQLDELKVILSDIRDKLGKGSGLPSNTSRTGR